MKEALVKASGNTSLYYPGIYLKKPQGDKKPIVQLEGEVNDRIIFKEL